MKEVHVGEKCEFCGNPLMRERWGDYGDLTEWRITCSVVICKMEPYHTTSLKEVKDANISEI